MSANPKIREEAYFECLYSKYALPKFSDECKFTKKEVRLRKQS